MAPRRAIAIAEGIKALIMLRSNERGLPSGPGRFHGQLKLGSAWGIPEMTLPSAMAENLFPIVAISIVGNILCMIAVSIAAAASAINGDGILGLNFGQARSSTKVNVATAVSMGENVGKASKSDAILVKKLSG